MRGFEVFGRRVVHFYHHFIMRMKVLDFRRINETGLRVRRIQMEDLPILAAGDFAIANMKKYLMEGQKTEGYLFFLNEIAVGYLWIVKKGGKELSYKIETYDAFLSCVCVFPEFRGQNIVNEMIGYIVSRMKTLGLSELGLGVNTDNIPAIRAYQKAGFEIVRERKYLRVLRRNFPYYSL